MTYDHDLTVSDFQKMFDDDFFPQSCRDLVTQLDFRHQVLTGQEREDMLLRETKALFADLTVSGAHRHGQWETGWKENLDAFVASGYDLDALTPKFYRKVDAVRLHGQYVRPATIAFETNCAAVLREYVFQKYFADINSLYEFGCGTGLNLIHFLKDYPEKTAIGLDWAQASVDILNLVGQEKGMNISGQRFDFFNLDPDFAFQDNSAVLTYAALEQLGEKGADFIDYLLQRNPKIVVNIETTYELYNQDDLMGYLGAKYLEKRNYLRGYLPKLQELEAAGKIKILKVQQAFSGLHHDGHTLIVWQPVSVR